MAGKLTQLLRNSLVLVLMVLPGILMARTKNQIEIDSLKEILMVGNDTTRINAMFYLSMAYQYSLPDSAMHYALKSKHEADALGYDKGKGDALISIGRLKRDKGQYDKALEDIFSSLKIYRKIKDSVQISNAINDISIVYAYSGDSRESLRYFKKALKIFQAINDTKGESQTLNNIGLIFLQMDNLSMAEDYMLRSLAIKKQRNDFKDIASGYGNLGKIMEERGEMDKALDYYRQAQEIYVKTNHKIALVENHLDIANVYAKKGMFHKANDRALQALTLSREVNSAPSIIKASSALMSIAERRKDYKASFEYLKLTTSLKDSLEKENSAQHLQELKQKYNAEDRENQIVVLKKDQLIQKANLRQKDIITISLASGIFLILIILFLLYRAYRNNAVKRNLLAFKNAKMATQRDGLIQVNRNKDQLFSIISHDMRSPLNSLKGFCTLLVNHLDDMSTEDIKQMGKKINQSLENLSELLDNLLTWSIIQRKEKQLELTRVNINELIRKNIELYALTLSAKNLKVTDHSEAGILAEADYNSVHTILRNLIGNAIKFSHPGDEIKIKAVKQTDHIEVSVTDDGVGMTDEGLAKLFNLKGRKSATGTFEEKGKGLGLILCKELVKDNRGEIFVKSQLERGSIFTFTLPRFVA